MRIPESQVEAGYSRLPRASCSPAAALAAATLPVQAASAAASAASAARASAASAAKAATPAPTTVTVTDPGATTEPLETPITLPLTATDTDVAGFPLTWSAPRCPRA